MGMRELTHAERRSGSGGRSRTYYWGAALMVIGGLIFVSGFLAAVTSVGDIDDLQNYDSRGRSMALRSIVGIALIGVGKFMRSRSGRGRGASPPGAGPSIMIRCLACDQVNEEDSKFCKGCGAPLRTEN